MVMQRSAAEDTAFWKERLPLNLQASHHILVLAIPKAALPKKQRVAMNSIV
jgi:hypothetical protein